MVEKVIWLGRRTKEEKSGEKLPVPAIEAEEEEARLEQRGVFRSHGSKGEPVLWNEWQILP